MPRVVACLVLASFTVFAWLGCRQIANIEDIQPVDASAADAGPRDATLGDAPPKVDVRPDAIREVGDENADATVPGCTCPGCKVLASGLAFPVSLLVHGSDVYVTSYGPADFQGALVRVPTNGGTPVFVVSDLNRPFSITSDKTNLYWEAEDVDGGVIVTSPFSDPGKWRALAKGLPRLQDLEYMGIASITTNAELAVTATDVYFVGFEPGTVVGVQPYGVLSVPIDGGTPRVVISEWPSDGGVDAGITFLPLGIVTDGQTLFASSFGPPTGIVAATLPAGPIRPFVNNITYAWAMDLQAHELYYSDDNSAFTTGILNEILVDAGSSSPLIMAGPYWMVVADNGVLYVIEANPSLDGARILRFDIKTKALTTLASGLASPQAIAIDSEFVYWVDPYCGSLLKVAK